MLLLVRSDALKNVLVKIFLGYCCFLSQVLQLKYTERSMSGCFPVPFLVMFPSTVTLITTNPSGMYVIRCSLTGCVEETHLQGVSEENGWMGQQG